MDRDWLRAVRERQDEVRDEIVRHRLGVRLRARRDGHERVVGRVRRALGRVLIGLGRVIEGDERESAQVSLPCN